MVTTDFITSSIVILFLSWTEVQNFSASWSYLPNLPTLRFYIKSTILHKKYNGLFNLLTRTKIESTHPLSICIFTMKCFQPIKRVTFIKGSRHGAVADRFRPPCAPPPGRPVLRNSIISVLTQCESDFRLGDSSPRTWRNIVESRKTLYSKKIQLRRNEERMPEGNRADESRSNMVPR